MAVYIDYNTISEVNTDADAINNSIRNILQTNIGSVPGQPEFGSRISEHLFAQMDHISKNSLIVTIEEALAQWEQRILVTDITISEIPEYNKITANIEYQYRDRGTFVKEQIAVGFTV